MDHTNNQEIVKQGCASTEQDFEEKSTNGRDPVFHYEHKLMFLRRLYDMLMVSNSADKNTGMVWNEDGQGFIVSNSTVLAQPNGQLQQLAGHNSMAVFSRELGRLGFSKSRIGGTKSRTFLFFHPYFYRGGVSDVMKIVQGVVEESTINDTKRQRRSTNLEGQEEKDVWEALDDVNSKVDLLSNRVDRLQSTLESLISTLNAPKQPNFCKAQKYSDFPPNVYNRFPQEYSPHSEVTRSTMPSWNRIQSDQSLPSWRPQMPNPMHQNISFGYPMDTQSPYQVSNGGMPIAQLGEGPRLLGKREYPLLYPSQPFHFRNS